MRKERESEDKKGVAGADVGSSAVPFVNWSLRYGRNPAEPPFQASFLVLVPAAMYLTM